MRIYRNVGHIQTQKRRARLMAIVGFLALIGTFPVAFLMSGNSSLILVTYVLLLGGFVLFNRGMQQIGKWSNSARHIREDLALDRYLEGLSDRYSLIHYGRPKKDLIDHALVHPGGVLVITTRDFPGQVSVENDHWRKGGSLLSRAFTFSGPQIGNPTRDTEKALDVVEQALLAEGLESDIEAVIVFTADTVDLDVDGSSDPVLPVDELAGYVRDLDYDVELTNSDREAIVAFLSQGEKMEAPVKTSTRRPVKVKKRVAS